MSNDLHHLPPAAAARLATLRYEREAELAAIALRLRRVQLAYTAIVVPMLALPLVLILAVEAGERLATPVAWLLASPPMVALIP